MAYNGKMNESIVYAETKCVLARQIYGEKSENYCSHLEELTNLYFET